MLNTKCNRQDYSHVTSNRIGYTNTRVISSNACVNGESGNWKLDYHKFKGHSFAHVLKHAIKNSTQVQDNSRQASSSHHLLSTKVVKSNITNVHVNDRIGLNAEAKVSARFESSKLPSVTTNFDPKIQGREGVGLEAEIGVGKVVESSSISTHNRYEVLQQDDAVVSRQSDSTASKPISDLKFTDMHNLKGTEIIAKRPVTQDASLCDANVKNNVRALATVDVVDQSISSTYADTNNQTTSKYDLPLRLRDKKLDYTNIMASCPTLQLWDEQNAYKFGFVPPTLSPSNVDTDPLTLHKIIKASGKYNFKDAQIRVKSQLNPDVWDSLLHGYWDSQLSFLIRFGFPLDFDRNSILEIQIITPLPKITPKIYKLI